MHLNLEIKEKLSGNIGFKDKLVCGITPCGVEYAAYLGNNAFYIFLALKEINEERKIHVSFDVLCTAIKKSFLSEYVAPTHITEELIEAIGEEDEVREKNIEFTSGIGPKGAITDFDVDLRPKETYLLTVR